MRTKIIYEDNHIIIVHKPAGLATQTSHIGQQDVASELKNYLAKIGQSVDGKRTSEQPYLGIIHRLDQPVEGLLVFAKTKEAAAKLTKQLSAGTLNKQYYANNIFRRKRNEKNNIGNHINLLSAYNNPIGSV